MVLKTPASTNAPRVSYKWSLSYKKEKNIDWENIHSSLLEAQTNLHDLNKVPTVISEICTAHDELNIKAQFWKQRAKIRWDSMGDQPTSYYYKTVKARNVKNHITQISDLNGSVFTEEADISEAFAGYFETLFESEQQATTLENQQLWVNDLPQLSEDHISHLNLQFSDAEIKKAVFSMKPLKSPGPDGAPPVFFHKTWHVTGTLICNAVKGFLNGGKMLRETNNTYIALIPKSKNPCSVSDFRPISLCNTTYKIISKCLVNRIKPILHDLVGEFQNAFIPGRQMGDSSLVAHELNHWIKKRKKGKLRAGLLKIDLSKAYDRVNWDFVLLIMKQVGFPQCWVNWVHECISTVSYRVLVNGSPSRSFKPQRGLRQGDPLSPYLFILVMDTLSKRLSHLHTQGLLRGIQIGRHAPSVNHLFFADDATFCFRASLRSVTALKNTLHDFCLVSGEMINHTKSSIVFSPNTPTRYRKFLSRRMQVREETNMGVYLGNNMNVDGRSSSCFSTLVQKIKHTISSWNNASLSQSGKLILINTILIAFSYHILSMYLLPKKVTNQISSSILKFWWQKTGDKKPIYWKKKALLWQHKLKGGLGLKNIDYLNKSLLFKQAWRLHSRPQLLSARMFKGRYGSDPIELAIKGKIPASMSWAGKCMVKASSNFVHGLNKRIGSGRQTNITDDIWLNNASINFKECYRSHPENPTMVSDLMTSEKKWNARLIWDRFDRKTAQDILATHIEEGSNEDSYFWPHSFTGDVDLKSAYWWQVNREIPTQSRSTIWKTLWHNKVIPPKCKMFIWKLIHGAIPVAKELLKRKMAVEPLCPLCSSSTETLAHLFRDCPISQRIWQCSNLGLQTFGQEEVKFDEWILNYLFYLNHHDKDHGTNNFIDFIAILWAIWLHRNDVVFNKVALSPSSIMTIWRASVSRWLFILNGKNSVTRPDIPPKPPDILIIGREDVSMGTWTLSTDGAWKESKGTVKAAIGWVIMADPSSTHTKGQSSLN